MARWRTLRKRRRQLNDPRVQFVRRMNRVVRAGRDSIRNSASLGEAFTNLAEGCARLAVMQMAGELSGLTSKRVGR